MARSGIVSKAKILAVCCVEHEDSRAVRSNISSKLGQQRRGKLERGLRKMQLERLLWTDPPMKYIYIHIYSEVVRASLMLCMRLLLKGNIFFPNT